MKKPPGVPTPVKHRPSPKELANLLPPWKPGQSGNPAGRGKGSRNALTEAFIEALYADFLEHGADAVIAARVFRPSAYLNVIAGLLPKQIEIDEEHSVYIIADRPLTIEEWADKYALGDSPPGLVAPGRPANGTGGV